MNYLQQQILEKIGDRDVITFSDYLLIRLSLLKVDTVFSLTGGGVMHIVDALYRSEDVNLISTHHEQCAGVAADAYSRHGKRLGVAMGTTGPGVTNLFTSVAAAWQDSSTVLFIAGQVKKDDSKRLNGLDGLRQSGTFEFDSLPSYKPITKFAGIITSATEGIDLLEQAIFKIFDGRPGPALIEIPLDVQGEKLFTRDIRVESLQTAQANGEDVLDICFEPNSKPLFIFGAGVVRANKVEQCRALANKLGVPYIVSALGKEIGCEQDEYYCGVIGLRGNRSANILSQQASTIIIIGCSMHAQICGWDPAMFNPTAKKFWFEIDDYVVNARAAKLNVEKIYKLSVEKSIKAIDKQIDPDLTKDLAWLDYCKRIKKAYIRHFPLEKPDSKVLCTYRALDVFNRHIDMFSSVVTDAGQPWYIVPQVVQIKKDTKFISSGSFGSMGMTLPYILGASVSAGPQSKPVLGITGDGSIMMCMQELATLKCANCSFVAVIINNSGYRSIRTTHDKFFNKRNIGTDSSNGLFFPEFEKLTAVFELDYVKIDSYETLDVELSRIAKEKRPKVVIEILVDPHQDVEPLVVSTISDEGKFVNSALDHMYPFVEYEKYNDN
jgi:acetolactate synthase I/II/III large subunit